MRAMKFRAWHKPSSAMMMVHTLHWNGNGECIGGYCHDDEWNEIAFDVTHTIIMQFTGLHDKNGKEIYEGDVVKHYNGVNPVTWETGLASFQMSFSNFVLDQEIIPDYSECEVIGNIYENPELVGGTQKGLELDG
jgi:uncharacterized phage protein (TIGR01671 family)